MSYFLPLSPLIKLSLATLSLFAFVLVFLSSNPPYPLLPLALCASGSPHPQGFWPQCRTLVLKKYRAFKKPRASELETPRLFTRQSEAQQVEGLMKFHSVSDQAESSPSPPNPTSVGFFSFRETNCSVYSHCFDSIYNGLTLLKELEVRISLVPPLAPSTQYKFPKDEVGQRKVDGDGWRGDHILMTKKFGPFF